MADHQLPRHPSNATAPVFQPIRSRRAFDEIASQIRSQLAEGKLRVGNRLPSERALAEQFGVSRNTLREALRSLEHAGLLRLRKGATGGAFITEASGDTIATGLLDMYHSGTISPEQLTEARIWLESVVVREACQRATPEDLENLRENVRQAEQANTQGDLARRAETNLEFHRIVARMTGNPVVVIVMDSMLAVLRHFVHTIGPYENSFVPPSRKRFIKLMEARDVSGAIAEMESSLKRLQRSYLSLAKEAAPVAAATPLRVPAVAATAAPAGSAKPRKQAEPRSHGRSAPTPRRR
ncbi:FadR/GntR family transcriptional regulator [Hydrogenophaga intermedia]|uniref:FadR/GntR family transcriptional regulator n=1 Tax=Hydrogenophaga intermedia TaxID=65786 RepID=UPI002043E578|nr:FadR/GntR family transcriptional regulator [Hydrogenophaga intermedia]MCM3562805.1 FadR family transcriptional regulator [Hydrogenophaga intermedia]